MKYTKSLLQTVFFAALLLTGTIAGAQSKKTEIKKLDLKPGQKFQTDNTLKTTSSMEMMGQQMDINGTVTVIRLLEVKDKKEKAYDIACSITKMAANIDALGQYDSDKKDDTASALAKLLKDQINNPVTIEMSDEGKVIPHKKDDTKAGDNADGLAAMMKSLGAGGDESMLIDDVFIAIPKKLKANDTWSDSTIAEGQKTYKDYTVKSIQGDEAVITIGGKVLTNRKTENQGMEMTVTMDSKLTGEMTIDINTGLIKQRSLVTEGSGNLEMMGGEMPMTSKMEATSITKGL